MKGLKMSIVKEEAKKLLDNLPDEASWDDILYEMYVRKKIDEGIKAADEGKLVSHEDVKKRFLK
jgi:predicted transcriptional regulator